jgi:hypothetical protein
MNKKSVLLIPVALFLFSGCALPWQFTETSDSQDGGEKSNNEQVLEHALFGRFNEDVQTYEGVHVSSNGDQRELFLEGYRPFNSPLVVPGESFFEKDGLVYMYDFESGEMKKTSMPKLKDVNRDEVDIGLAYTSQVSDEDKVLFMISYTDTTTQEYKENTTNGLALVFPDEVQDYLYDKKTDTYEETNYQQKITDSIIGQKGEPFGPFIEPRIIDLESQRIVSRLSGEGVGSSVVVYDAQSDTVSVPEGRYEDVFGFLVPSNSVDPYLVQTIEEQGVDDVQGNETKSFIKIRDLSDSSLIDSVELDQFYTPLFHSEKMGIVVGESEGMLYITSLSSGSERSIFSLSPRSGSQLIFFEDARKGFVLELIDGEVSVSELNDLDTI